MLVQSRGHRRAAKEVKIGAEILARWHPKHELSQSLFTVPSHEPRASGSVRQPRRRGVTRVPAVRGCAAAGYGTGSPPSECLGGGVCGLCRGNDFMIFV